MSGTELKAGTALQQLPAGPAAIPVPAAEPSADEGARAGLSLVRSISSGYWAKIDCIRDAAHNYAQEKYLNKSRHADPEIVAAFGSGFPQTDTFLLHYGRKWNTNSGKAVILLHGASDNATRAWAAPEMMTGDASRPGLAQALEEKGYRVFAVTFPHKHGSLFYEAEHTASAIETVKRLTGARKVVLIGHSAGGLAARAYVSGYRLNGFTAYRGDVEQLVTLATPHGGQDFQFRHPDFNYFFVKDELAANAPMSWDKILYYGQWKDTLDFSVYGDYFPMQQQVLRDWTARFPVNPAVSQDWYTTYHGGQGFVSHSMGIKEAIARGGNFMNELRRYPVAPGVAVTVLAGTDNRIDNVPQTESDGPSDGLVFVESACATDGMAAAGAEPVKKLLVNANHLTITYRPEPVRLILSILK